MQTFRVFFSSFLLFFIVRIALSQSISGGYYHTVYLCSDSSVWASGFNFSGELGLDTNSLPTPNQISTLNNIVAISAGGNHTLALDVNGKVWTWGNNNHGQLGDTSLLYSNNPIQLPLTNIIKVVAGESFSFALRSDGSLWGWGQNNSGQLGLGHNDFVDIPTLNPYLNKITQISGGQSHALAVKSDGTVWAWGDNTQYQLGLGTNISSDMPVLVPNLTNIKMVSAGFYHSVAVKNNGSVWTWGYNEYGALGNGTTDTSYTPTPVAGINNAIEAQSGQYHTVIRTTDGAVMTWGLNNYGQVGNGTFQNVFSPYTNAVSGVVEVFAGVYHTGFYISSGQPFIYGLNANYQAGNNNSTNITAATITNIGCNISKFEPVCFAESNFYPSSSNACQGSEIVFNNTSNNAFDFEWLIDDVSAATGDSLMLSFNDTGLHKITLIADPAGCADSASLWVTIDEEPKAVLYVQEDICEEKDSVLLYADGSQGNWWGNGVSGNILNPSLVGVGEHEVYYTMSNSSCSRTDTLKIDVNTSPQASFIYNSTGDTVIFSNNSSNADNYQWFFGDGQSSSQENPTHFYSQEGSYYVLLLASNSCGTETYQELITLSSTGNLAYNSNKIKISVFPNPATNKIEVNNKGTELSQFFIFNSIGQEVFSGKITSSTTEIDISKIESGSYIIRFIGKEIYNQPLIITR